MNTLIDLLTERVGPYMSKKRLEHTLGVARTSDWICDFFPDLSKDNVIIASMLHDVAKELDTAEQLRLIRDFSVSITDEDAATRPALHSFAAVALIKRDFPDLAYDTVLSAVYNHTLGTPGMSVADRIVFLADFIEPGRTHSSAIEIREYLKAALRFGNPRENERALNKCVLMAIESTVSHLASDGVAPNSSTLALRNEILSLI